MSTLAPDRRGVLSRIAAISDGAIVRAVFFMMLAGVVAVLYIDYRELAAQNGDGATAPLLPALPFLNPDGPMLPAGPAITTDRALLDAPLAVALAAGGTLELTGTIDVGAAERFATEVEARGEYVTNVALNSPGGSLNDAIEIGDLLRERGFSTSVADGALCASSCPLILAAGVDRGAGRAAAVGVHQFSALLPADQVPSGLRATGDAMANAQETTARITRYLTRMGVDPAVWIHALETPPSQLYYLSYDEMETYRLITPAAGATAKRTAED